MKLTTYLICWAVMLFVNTGMAQHKPIKKKISTAENVSDLALIYHGGNHRLRYTTAQMKPYVFREVEGKPEYLFDSFLFLEIVTKANGKEYDFGVELPYRSVPNKTEWDALLKETFAIGRGPDAVEHTIDSLVRLGYPPPTKRKIFFALPNPIYGNKNWGSINGKKLDLGLLKDRFAAAKWYVDQIEHIWKKKKYKYMELCGFYWLHETIDHKNQDDQLISQVSTFLKKKKHDLIWIPYNWAEGAEDWQKIGFTKAYQQPNYYFDLKSGLWILQRGIEFAKEHGLHLEFEFDEKVAEEGYRKHFYDYVEQFQNGGVWDTKEVAYYEGGGAWYRLSISSDPELKKMFKLLGDIIVKRQSRLK